MSPHVRRSISCRCTRTQRPTLPPRNGRLLPWHILVPGTGTKARALAPHLRTRAVSHRLQLDRVCGPPVAFVAGCVSQQRARNTLCPCP
eukprot:830150-Pleurochrysis_carterae.AAC.1